jgi:hypothetical protein
MKKTILITLIALLLVGCVESQPFVGYLVCKEYIKHHMSNEEPKIIQQAAVFIQRPYVNPKPHYVPSEWRFYVANKYGTRCFNVDSMTYLKYNIGDKLIFN